MPMNLRPVTSIPGAWPAVSLSEAMGILTAPGARFEMESVDIRGVTTRVWKNAPPTTAVLCNQSRAHGERPFSIYESERISYEANFRAVATIAHWLVSQGVAKGDRVALAMRNVPEWPAIFLATTVIGAIAVPLNAWWSGPELCRGLADSDASVLFCDAERYQRIAPLAASLSQLRFTVLGRAGDAVPDGTIALEEIAHRSADYARLPTDALPGASLEPEDIAAIFYTSGTTGRPKGAMGTHRNILTNIFTTGYGAARNCLRRGEPLAAAISRVRLITVPLFHVTGCVSLISGMPAGNTSIFMRRWDPLEAMRIIERERVNITGGVPTIAWELLEHHERGEYDLSSLESIAYGGAPAPAELVRRIHDELGAMPGTGWGMTETMSTVSVLSAEDYLDRPHSCGPAVPVANLKIMDLNGTSEIPVDELGELWAKGPMVVQGYWNQPEASAAVFVDGWVRTGDIARLDEDGFCTIVDRAKDMIIRGGENIFCPEVEAIIDDHPAVREAALIGISHRTLGEEPAAIVHLEPGMCASEAEIQAWVRDRLAVFKVPVRVVFSVDPLPRNAGGKVMKAELRARFEQR